MLYAIIDMIYSRSLLVWQWCGASQPGNARARFVTVVSGEKNGIRMVGVDDAITTRVTRAALPMLLPLLPTMMLDDAIMPMLIIIGSPPLMLP